ncbi:hypothetical protein MPSEU_000828500 [Mayamaea pseudoterrestris]|nr:hypothetical protein MPSEU_000828500 [Mayamaea pseudoterrestris]
MFITISQPLSIWMQLGSLFFTLGAVHADILVIRFFMVSAYSCLFLQAVLGGPLWPYAADTSNESLKLDALLWSILNLYLHGFSLVVLLTDEAKVQLTDDQAALWRLFYRTGGMSERIFYEVMVSNGHVQVVECDADTTLDTDNHFYILYQGSVTMHIQDARGESIDRQVGRGEIFDFKHLGMLNQSKYFQETFIRCETKTKAKFFQFSKDSMSQIAHHPLSKVVWQSLLINNLSRAVANARRGNLFVSEECADDIFAPLASWELPDATKAGSGQTLHHPFQYIWLSMRRSCYYPWPCGRSTPGMRQTQLAAPVSLTNVSAGSSRSDMERAVSYP